MKNPLEFSIDLSREVGNILKDRYTIGGIESDIKSDTSIVTKADVEADKLITQSIHANFPKDIVLSEELNTNIQNLTEAIWVVDPLDGTTNFVLGLQYWGISIARLVNGYLTCAVIYFPMIDELYSAEYQHGAFLNGEQIYTKAPDVNQTAAFFSCCSRTFRQYDISIPYKARILGSATYTFCAVASGIAVVGFEATPKVWDIAAGWLIVTEAGGAVETLNHEQAFPLKENFDYNHQSFPTLCAANAALLQKTRSQIKSINIHSLYK